jgi:murein L,D-transpeptidase YafK
MHERYQSDALSKPTSIAYVASGAALALAALGALCIFAIPRASAQQNAASARLASRASTTASPAVRATEAAQASPAAQGIRLAASVVALPIARLHVSKTTRLLTAYAANGTVVLTRQVALGSGGVGYKLQEGDRITPVGRYHVVLHAWSAWHEFMLLDYPNADDRARFARLKAAGKLAAGATIGGQVGIHGSPRQQEAKPTHKLYDWTLGCVALDDDEIAELAKLVRNGTIVDIEE